MKEIEVFTIGKKIDFKMLLFHPETYLLFGGGLASLLLSVVVIYSRREYRRTEKLQDLQNHGDTDEYGDIEVYLNELPDYEKLSFLELMATWSLQPLYIVSFINLFNSTGKLELAIVFLLTLLVIVHEFWAGNKYSSDWRYKSFMIILWLVLLITFSCLNNL